MGRNIYIEKVVMSNDEYYDWAHKGKYLSFNEEYPVSFEEVCADLGLELKDHYETEDDYIDAKFEIEQELYWNGYYNYNSIGSDFEDGEYIEWDFTPVDDWWVIIRVHFS